MKDTSFGVNNNSDQFNEMLRLKQAAALLGISEVTLWRLAENTKDFPPKIRISARCVGYRRGDLLAWQQSRMGG